MRFSDEEFIFNETVKERKGPAYSAKRKKGGSKSRRCNLLSDRLTPAQIKRKHGDIKMFAMNMPNTWEDFISQASDIQQEYIESLISRFDISVGKLISMFGVTHYAFTAHAMKMGYYEKIRNSFRSKPGPTPRENLENWIAFLNKKKQQSEIDTNKNIEPGEDPTDIDNRYFEIFSEIIPEYDVVNSKVEPEEDFSLAITSEFICSGRIDLDKLMTEIKEQLGDNIVVGSVSIKIETKKR